VACLGAAEALATAAALRRPQHRPADAATLLLEAAVILHEGLAVSPAAPALRLALVAVMSLLCAGDAAGTAWDPLAVRHVQLESMAHHIMPAALCAGAAPQRLRGLLAAADAFDGATAATAATPRCRHSAPARRTRRSSSAPSRAGWRRGTPAPPWRPRLALEAASAARDAAAACRRPRGAAPSPRPRRWRRCASARTWPRSRGSCRRRSAALARCGAAVVVAAE
jgi:hypothetical protein